MMLRASVALLLAGAASLATAQWYPVAVELWEPPFNSERQRSEGVYTPLEGPAGTRWNLCVSIPHLKDSYWLGVNYGLVDQARSAGVNLAIFEAGGYQRLDVQRQQLAECLRDPDIDGIILSAIAADAFGDLLAEAKRRKLPVVDLINGVDAENISARTAVDYYDTGYQAGLYLRGLTEGAQGEVRVAWFPGPEGAAWAARGDAGFRAAIADSQLRVVATRWGDTGRSTQARLLQDVLDEYGERAAQELDYVVGTTVTAEAAVVTLRSRQLTDEIGVLAYYYGPGVHQGIKRGTIIAAPTDSQVLQARLAVDVITRILEGQPFEPHVAPRVEVIDQSNIRQWDSSTTLPPRGFRAIFSVGER